MGLLGYEAQKSSYDPKKNNSIRPYFNERNHVAIIWDNFILRLEYNPTIYTHGHNVTMCTLNECISSVHSLGLELDTDLFEWDAVGYDWNVTVQVNYPCAAYLPLLQEHTRYKRSTNEKNTGRHYENGGKKKNRTLTAYNKIEECTKKAVIIPSSFSGQNLFRIEHSVVNKIKEYKCFESVTTVQDFLTPQNWNNAAHLFLITYEEIRKHEKNNNLMDHVTLEHFTSTQKGKLHDILVAGDISKYVIEQQIKFGKGLMHQRRFKARVKDARSIWNEYTRCNKITECTLLQELNDKVRGEVDRLKIK